MVKQGEKGTNHIRYYNLSKCRLNWGWICYMY